MDDVFVSEDIRCGRLEIQLVKVEADEAEKLGALVTRKEHGYSFSFGLTYLNYRTSLPQNVHIESSVVMPCLPRGNANNHI
jgi:hypothetical protein